MSVKVLSAVLERSPSKGNRLLALIVLANNANDAGWAFPGQDDIARHCRVTKRAAQKTLDALEAAGEVIIYNRVNPNSPAQHYSNCYHLARYGTPDAAPPVELRGELKARVHMSEGDVLDDMPPSEAHDMTPDVPDDTTPDVPDDTRVVSSAPSDPSLNPKEKDDSEILVSNSLSGNARAAPLPDQQQAWDAAYHQLELQLDRGSFDRYFGDAALLGLADRCYVVGVRHEHARDVCQSTYHRMVHRILRDVLAANGQDIELQFVVKGDQS